MGGGASRRPPSPADHGSFGAPARRGLRWVRPADTLPGAVWTYYGVSGLLPLYLGLLFPDMDLFRPAVMLA